MNPPPPPPGMEFVLPQAITDVTVAIAAQIMQAAKNKCTRAKSCMCELVVTASMDIFSDFDDYPAKRTKPNLTRLDHWQLGNKAARERKSKSGYVDK